MTLFQLVFQIGYISDEKDILLAVESSMEECLSYFSKIF